MNPAIYQQYFAALNMQSKEKPEPIPQNPKAKKAEEALAPLLKKGKRNAIG